MLKFFLRCASVFSWRCESLCECERESICEREWFRIVVRFAQISFSFLPAGAVFRELRIYLKDA